MWCCDKAGCGEIFASEEAFMSVKMQEALDGWIGGGKRQDDNEMSRILHDLDTSLFRLIRIRLQALRNETWMINDGWLRGHREGESDKDGG